MFNSQWYNNLTKPPFAPPNNIFAPAWAVLYTTIFLALVIYMFAKGQNKSWGYIFFVIQLFLNFAWSPVFFGMQNMGLALIIIILLDIFVFLTMKEFWTVSKLAGMMLVPYMLWILFATYLNAGYLLLN